MATKVLNGLDLTGQKIVNVGDPTATTDAANKAYVDNFVRGLSWKTSVVAASTTNVTVSSAPATLDTVTLAEGDRVLLKNQSTASQNGIYVYTSTGAALTRAPDMADGVDARGFVVTVMGGATHDDQVWHVTSDPAVVGTDAITWSQLGGGGGTYTAGEGLTESPAGTFNVNVGTGLEVVSDAVRIASGAAGDGLTGGGTTSLAVGEGTGITVNTNDVAIDTAVVVRKYAVNVPSGSTTATITHNLNTYDVTVEVFANSGVRETVLVDVERASVNSVELKFAVAPSSDQYRCVVHG